MSVQYKPIGKRITSKRKQLELTQAELAEKANLTPKYISKIDSTASRSLSIKSVLQLCEALDVSPSYLLLGTDDDDPSAIYIDVAQRLRLCDARQLRQVSNFIDAVITN